MKNTKQEILEALKKLNEREETIQARENAVNAVMEAEVAIKLQLAQIYNNVKDVAVAMVKSNTALLDGT